MLCSENYLFRASLAETKDGGTGHFTLPSTFLARYRVQTVGACVHQEFWQYGRPQPSPYGAGQRIAPPSRPGHDSALLQLP